MVYFALNSQGAHDAVEACVATKSALWVTADSMLESELQAARARGVRVTSFSSLAGSATPEEISDAVATIREHHPSETIWVLNRGDGLTEL
jgi:hypothetical protein